MNDTDLHGSESVAGREEYVESIRRMSADLNVKAGTDGNLVGAPCSPSRVVQLKSTLRLPDAHPLIQFYSLADGLSLMDCFNGVAIHRVAQILANSSDPHVPNHIGDSPCICFGSTGGGDLFCILKSSGEIVRLTEVSVEDGRLIPEEWQIRTVASEFPGFLSRVAEDLSAYLEDRDGHHYLSTP